MLPADLEEARNLAVVNAWVVLLDAARVLKTQLRLFLTDLLTALPDSSDDNQRAILNWIPIARPLLDALPATNGTEKSENANDVGLLLYRICEAANVARTENRITAGQATAILNAYIARFT